MKIEDFEKEVKRQREASENNLLRSLQEFAKNISLEDLLDIVDRETINSLRPRIKWENDTLGISILCSSPIKGFYSVEIKDDELRLLRVGYSEYLLTYKKEGVLGKYNSIRHIFGYKRQDEPDK